MPRNEHLVRRYDEELRLFPTRHLRIAMLLLAASYFILPFWLSEFWVSVLNFVGMFAIGAIGLNLLTGFTGQVSLGHAFFLAIGAYTAANIGGDMDLPMIVWLPAAAVIGGAVGALIGPFALRLHGNYLAIVTLGLLFLGEHLFNNWTSVTGGGSGTSVTADLSLGPLDFTELELFGSEYSRVQGLFWLIWAVVALGALIAKNIVRTRPGRAMQAVRDRDLAAEVMGVSLTRHKLIAFTISSFYAGIAGALLPTVTGFIEPGSYNLLLSVQFLAMILIGGVATLSGSLLGAAFVILLPRLVEELPRFLPFVASQSTGGVLTTFQLQTLLYGVLIVVFLIAEPRGLFGIWVRARNYWRAWPFSY
jgi:branched-chain amino acid transport system permease protein